MKDIILISLIIIFLFICFNNPKVLENWEIYKQKDYNHIYTGRKPIQLYEHQRYRKPYRYPFQIIKSYPTPHLTYLD